MNNSSALAELDALSARGREFLGVRHAIVGGAMSWLSERHLVAATSNSGAFGVIATGSLSPEELREEVKGTFALTDKPFGVNVIIMHPELNELLQVCIDEGVGHVVLAGGLPPRSATERLKAAGVKVIAFAPTLMVAKKLSRQGVDAFIIEGMEAGGHTGPVATSVLCQEILPHLRDVPVFVGGGIGRGDAIALYLQMGAAGCQIGTRFVCATESIAHEKFKKAFLHAKARDAQLSVQLDPEFPVIPVRALANKATEQFFTAQRDAIARFRSGELDQKEAQLVIERFWAGSLRRAVIDGDIENGSLMAGQSVGMVAREQPVAEIVEELMDQAAGTLARGREHLSTGSG
ncbi:MAG: 2-nitropropane dioxygenase [Rhodospirillaceae bacterium]|jgi:enoyl-[acyl-carrier protein] reductase II|nr:2-nitropropane dioxygenase [Rhodospirillaceae bacterium]MBT4425688.1 2-nitropropane dioxygenase [Rhodospirillaceae bacterium]MBT5778402.1 2-nitropropane dioxygenase [Rhodospirillaceae bacterium]MBT6827951.1 2-nitropropane dioxygenase [Rhodospirillaceae bacterium]MBT7293958.1 2-nitropropane dioxygenase [Rhodospirillaceae bacterium]